MSHDFVRGQSVAETCIFTLLFVLVLEAAKHLVLLAGEITVIGNEMAV